MEHLPAWIREVNRVVRGRPPSPKTQGVNHNIDAQVGIEIAIGLIRARNLEGAIQCMMLVRAHLKSEAGLWESVDIVSKSTERST